MNPYKRALHEHDRAHRTYNIELVRYFKEKGYPNPHGIVIMLQRLLFLAYEFGRCDEEGSNQLVSHPRYGNNWFFHTNEQMEEYSLLTITIQERIRKILVKEGLIEYQSFGQPQKLHYRINMERYEEIKYAPSEIQKKITNFHEKSKLKTMIHGNQNPGTMEIGHIYSSSNIVERKREAPKGADFHIDDSSFYPKIGEGLQVAEAKETTSLQHNIDYQVPSQSPPKLKVNPREAPKGAMSADADVLLNLFISSLKKTKEDIKLPANLSNWRRQLNELLCVDKRKLQEVKELLDWLPSCHFWRKNILSPSKLREKYDTLILEKNQPQIKKIGNSNANIRQTIREQQMQRYIEANGDPDEGIQKV
jgi:hypothetical protein